MLKPSIKQMLEVGYGCGLTYVEEAYAQYMSHYDCFFLIEKMDEQLKTLHEELEDMRLISRSGNYQYQWIGEPTIKQTLEDLFAYTEIDFELLEYDGNDEAVHLAELERGYAQDRI